MNFMSNLPLYEMLTKLGSGYLLSILLLPEDWSNKIEVHLLGWIFCYIIGLIYHGILDWFSSAGLDCLRNNECMLKKSHRKMRKEFPQRMKKRPIKEDYYEAYYCLMKNNGLGSVLVLEAQVAFIRDLVPILGFYFVGFCFFEFGIYKEIHALFGSHCAVVLSSLALIVMLMVVRYLLQKKIYELVWEGSCFIQDKEGGEKK